MSKIRSRTELQEAMSAEFAWRKKELHRIKLLVLANESSHNRDMCVRAAVTLLYAHWEGFIKRISECYLEFVARQRLTYDELPAGFLAMAISPLLSAATATRKTTRHIQLVEFFRNETKTRCNLNWWAGINTKSNLKSELFHEIVESLGLDYSRFATKEKLIDEKLLNHRNRIAHGQYLLVDVAEYLALHNEVFAIMQDFYNQVDNAAFAGTFKR